MNLRELQKTTGAYWSGLAQRERALSSGALLVIAAAVLWWLALAPALRTLRQSDSQQRQLDLQWQQVQNLQAQAQLLKAQRTIPRDEALRALEASVKATLGATAELKVSGDRATLTLKNTPAQALARWLTQARTNAHVLPMEARLQRSAVAQPSAPGASATSSPALSTLPSMEAMPAVGSLPVGGLMPGVGISPATVAPRGDAHVKTSGGGFASSATWSGTLLLNLP